MTCWFCNGPADFTINEIYAHIETQVIFAPARGQVNWALGRVAATDGVRIVKKGAGKRPTVYAAVVQAQPDQQEAA